MTEIYFDTLIFSHKLADAGMPTKQAEIVAEAQKEAFEAQHQYLHETLDKAMSTHLATKEDLSDLRHELKQDISDLRHELKQDISDLKIELKHVDKKVDLLRKEFEGKFTLLYWMVGFTLTFCVTIVMLLLHLIFK